MTAHTYELPFRIQLGRPAASSSLPPELKVLLNHSGNELRRFDVARITQMLSTTVASL